jgi:hypothetical protein
VGGDLTPWGAIAASVAGSGHRARDVGCQDACAIELHEGSLLLAVADGAGSARLAAEGSALAVAVAMEELRVRAGDALCGRRLVDVLAAARAALEPHAGDDPLTELGDRATTLLVARVTEEAIVTAQVGDGAIVVRRVSGDGDGPEALEVLCPAERGEYLNETCFLTSDSWEDELRVGVVPADGVDAIAGLTDGLQLLAFDMATGEPHAPFFEPFFSFASANGSADDLAAFLASERVAERTDDDVTLAVAARPSSSPC